MNKLQNKVFMQGVDSHKYNESKNEKVANTLNSPSDRMANDTGEEMEFTNFDNK